ncbi:MAG: phosphatase PAP2 family protein [Myxococcales bacterium]|nr:phosphatase PAP2 family protein [Myxococcales bacterium]
MDASLFLWIHGLRTPALDGAMSFLSKHGIWWPPLVWLLMVLWKRRAAAPVFRDGMLAWYLAGTVSEEWVKSLVKRARPPHNPQIQRLVHVLGDVPRRGSYSFPSGTSALVFAGATIIWLAWGRRAGIAAMVAATVVSLSRVYVGVHYPGDLLGGALVGALVAAGVWRFSKWAGTYEPNKPERSAK